MTSTHRSWLFKIGVMLLVSIGYAVPFYLAYTATGNGIVTNINLIPAFIIAGLWGVRAAVIMTSINILFWTNIIIGSVTPQASFFEIYTLIGITIHFTYSIVVGSFSTLIRKLRHEINERKNAEHQLKNYQNHLEEMVKVRTSELEAANERLRQVEKMEAVGQLAGGIAHDFNNQLTIVLGYTDVLKRMFQSNPTILDYLQQIHNAGKRASDLTRQLLAFARKSVYKMQTVNINLLVSEIKTFLSRGINKNITIITDLQATNPNVWGGATQLQNALLNLALNACDAMENGGTLTIHTDHCYVDEKCCELSALTLGPGNYVKISVQDTGTGIDDVVKRHLFEPFFTTKTEGKGTGMGLAAVYGIVKSHKGGIIVDSELHKGSTFTLFLPQTQNLSEPSLDSKPQPPQRKTHILIVDDEKDVAATIRDMLKDPLFTITIANSGIEAEKLYRQLWETIDVVIIDMLMPGIDGHQTFNSLKKINNEIKAIISSGYALTHKVEQTLKNGAHAFLQKPYSKKELIDQIREILDSVPVKKE